MAALVWTRLEIGLAARTEAYRRASGRSASGSVTFQTNPIECASSASIHSELISTHVAFCLPTRAGKVKLEAASGETPRLVKGHFSRAVVDMKARSANPKMVVPMPRPKPFTAMISGFGNTIRASINPGKPCTPGLKSGSEERAAISRRSVPAQKARPFPVRSTTATSGSSAELRSVSVTAS